MTDRPIIFSGAMVQALLAGRKTMTRRLALTSRLIREEITPSTYHSKTKIMPSPWQKAAAGDRLWVRENLSKKDFYIHYPADGEILGWEILRSGSLGRTWPTTWLQNPRPSIHMPRDASRLTLIVTEVKVERLWDISDDDIRAEGIENTTTSWLNAWRELWESINGPHDWKRNPQVVALSFRVVRSNIDRMPE
jgi:hypothetical protein